MKTLDHQAIKELEAAERKALAAHVGTIAGVRGGIAKGTLTAAEAVAELRRVVEAIRGVEWRDAAAAAGVARVAEADAGLFAAGPSYRCQTCGGTSWAAGGRPVCCHCGHAART